ncbi:MAG: SRPBCC family protein [Dehalococcoidia bacterium]
MASAEKSIEINVPVNTAYDEWRQYERFPQFMEGIEEVRKLDDRTLHWRASIGGKEEEWDARIIDEVPAERIAWQSIDGATNAGVVRFEAIDAVTTRVNLQLDYQPEGFIEKAGDMLGVVSRRVEGDLERFKEMVERKAAA